MNQSEGAQCRGKIRHEQRSGAEGQMVSLKRRYGDQELDVYQCPHCAGWHVGHRPERTKRRRRGTYK